MLFYLFLCNILFIYPIVGVNTTESTGGNNTLNLPSNDLKKVEASGDITKINLLTEGGPITQTTQTVKHSEETHLALLNLDAELSKVKSTVPSNSKVVARKGVMIEDKSATKQTTSSSTLQTVSLNTVETHNNKTLNGNSSTESSANKTQLVNKKPLVLSDEALANMPDVQRDELKIPGIQSSRISVVADQIQSPRIQVSTSRHPGLVMPIVITILVVPMFAVLGYMAMKRGRDAWKNRHYKRMDFLLDGMYNE